LVDGDLVLHRLKNPLIILGVTGLFGGLPAIYIIATGQFLAPSWQIILFGLVTGIVSLFAYYPYFRALETANPASAILLWKLSPVFVAVFALVFFGERLSATKYIAIALLILSAVIVDGLHIRSRKIVGGTKAASWMVLASCMTAAQALMEKQLFTSSSSSTGLALISLGSFLSGAVLLFLSKQRRTIVRAFAKDGLLLAGNQLLDVAATVCLSLAISLGAVSLVVALEGVQALFILGLAWIASRIFSPEQFRVAKAPPAWRIIIAVVLTIGGLTLIV
jgi:uncharacterized membrane protein